MDQRIVAARLWHFAAHHAAARGYVFGDGVELMLPQLAQQMAQRVIERAAIEHVPDEGLLRMAEGNLSAYVDAMIDAAMNEPGYFASRGPVIGELTWDRARKALCPVWPIC
jgi:hypothetical protein